MKNKFIRRGIPFLLVVLLAFAGPLQFVFAAASNSPNIELTLAVGTSNTDVSNFVYDVQTVVYEAYGISKDRIKISRAGKNLVDSKWFIYDHFYAPDYPTDGRTPANWSVAHFVNQPYFYFTESYSHDKSKYFTDVNLADDSLKYNYDRSQHIYLKDSGIYFLGYGLPAYKDFMVYPEPNGGEKTIQFTIDANGVSTTHDTVEGVGFLFNTGITNNKINGYLVFYDYLENKKIKLYKLTNVDAAAFHNEYVNTISSLENLVLGNPGINLVATKDSQSNNSIRNIKVQVTKNTLKYYEDSKVIYDTTGADSDILIEDTGAGGFGPLVSNLYHGCDQLSYFVFKNLTRETNRSLSFQEVIEEQVWNENTKRFIVNLDDDGVPEFSSSASLSPILAFMQNNRVDYIGWGHNNVTSAVYNKDQAEQFIAQNGGKGIFINMDEPKYDNYSKGISAITQYIYSQLTVTPDTDNNTDGDNIDQDHTGGGASNTGGSGIKTVEQPPLMFSDMKNHWAEKDVEKLGALKLLKGYADGTFRPDNQITRAEFATLLAKVCDLAGTKDTETQQVYFSDVSSGDWYYDAINRLAPEEIILGYGDGTFGPNKLITREETGAMIARLASKLSIQLELAELTFKDSDQISTWAKNSLAMISSLGIITGLPDGKFYPSNNSTRAEATVMMLRLVEKAKLI